MLMQEKSLKSSYLVGPDTGLEEGYFARYLNLQLLLEGGIHHTVK